jgi:hypothetical protein
MKLWSYMFALLLGVAVSVEYKAFSMEETIEQISLEEKDDEDSDPESDGVVEKIFKKQANRGHRITLARQLKAALNKENMDEAITILKKILEQPKKVFNQYQLNRLLRTLMNYYGAYEHPFSSKAFNALVSLITSLLYLAVVEGEAALDHQVFTAGMAFLLTGLCYKSKLFLLPPTTASLSLRQKLCSLIQALLEKMKERGYKKAVETNHTFIMEELLPSWFPVTPVFFPFDKPAHKVLERAAKLPDILEREESRSPFTRNLQTVAKLVSSGAILSVFDILVYDYLNKEPKKHKAHVSKRKA